MSKLSRTQARARRHKRLRRKISGTAERPRMAVCRTTSHIYVQLIDDVRRHTMVAASTMDPAFRESDLTPNTAGAAALGRIIAEKAKAADIGRVVFDRGGFAYHGRIKALAEAAREAGLTF